MGRPTAGQRQRRQHRLVAHIRFHSLHLPKVCEAFEQAGIPVEDPVDLRCSRALPVKLIAASETIEGLFWALLVGGAVVIGLIATLVNGCVG